MDKGELIDLGPLTQDGGFNTLARPPGGANMLQGCVLEAWSWPWSTLSDIEMPELLCWVEEEGIIKLSGCAM